MVGSAILLVCMISNSCGMYIYSVWLMMHVGYGYRYVHVCACNYRVEMFSITCLQGSEPQLAWDSTYIDVMWGGGGGGGGTGPLTFLH